jgi:cysteine desulfurase / selenocysteine lyase
MDIPRLHELRELFPITRDTVYFNNAATGPLPTSVISTLTEFMRRCSLEGEIPYPECEAVVAEARGQVAQLLRVKPSEIAFTKNTSAGIIIAINAIEWHDGDNMILMKDAFPADSYPFHYLLPHVEKRYVTSRELANGSDCVFQLVDRRTRAISLDWVDFQFGIRSDIAAVAEFCRGLNIRFIVDAIQGLGVVDMDFSAVDADFVVSSANKWLFSPQGNGILYVNARTLPKLKPSNLGWLSAEWLEFNDILSPKPLKTTAARYEEGTKNYMGIYGINAALKILLGVGLPEAAAQNRLITDRLRKGLRDLGFTIHTPEEPRRSAGILTVSKPDADMKAMHERLEAARVVCALRENRLRIAPHFYNTLEEAGRFLEVIAEE